MEDANFWQGWTEKVIKALLHAAALGEQGHRRPLALVPIRPRRAGRRHHPRPRRTVSRGSALKRARASLQRQQQPAAGHQPPPAAGSPAEDAIVAVFARAWESADLDALVALLTDDVFIAMPPEPFGYEGRELVARYCARQFAAGRRFDLMPARANDQPAFGVYLRGPAGIRHATAFYVLTLAGGQICGMTRFESSVLPWFGLPRSLPSR